MDKILEWIQEDGRGRLFMRNRLFLKLVLVISILLFLAACENLQIQNNSKFIANSEIQSGSSGESEIVQTLEEVFKDDMLNWAP